jgi:hypothetical protein
MSCKLQVCVVPLAILMYVENGRLQQTVCLCQLLPYNKEKCYRNYLSIESGFGRAGGGFPSSN